MGKARPASKNGSEDNEPNISQKGPSRSVASVLTSKPLEAPKPPDNPHSSDLSTSSESEFKRVEKTHAVEVEELRQMNARLKETNLELVGKIKDANMRLKEKEQLEEELKLVSVMSLLVEYHHWPTLIAKKVLWIDTDNFSLCPHSVY